MPNIQNFLAPPGAQDSGSAVPQGGPAPNMLGVGAAPAQQQQADPLLQMQSALQSHGMDDHQAIQRLQWTISGIGKLLASPKTTKSDVISELAEAVKDGVMPAKDAAALVPTIPEQTQQLTQWLKANFAKAYGALQSIEPHVGVTREGKYRIARNAAQQEVPNA